MFHVALAWFMIGTATGIAIVVTVAICVLRTAYKRLMGGEPLEDQVADLARRVRSYPRDADAD